MLTRVNKFTNVTYKDDPTILAWELINEPRCQEDNSGKTVNVWDVISIVSSNNLIN